MVKQNVVFSFVCALALVFVAVVFFLSFNANANNLLSGLFGEFGGALVTFISTVLVLGFIWALIKLFMSVFGRS